ncbi:MAG: hypothetical protein AAF514_18590 [Verrucomicrobiota bacterium]
MTRTSGTYVIEARPEFKIAAHNQLADDKTQFNATPAIAGNALYLRSDSTLYRIEK